MKNIQEQLFKQIHVENHPQSLFDVQEVQHDKERNKQLVRFRTDRQRIMKMLKFISEGKTLNTF